MGSMIAHATEPAELTEDNRQRLLVYHEDIAIKRLKSSAEDLRVALDHIQTIKDMHLYRGAWSDYCKAKFGFTRQRHEQLIKHLQTLEVIGNIVAADELADIPESWTRYLSTLSEGVRGLAYETAKTAAANDGKKCDANYINAAVEQIKEIVATSTVNVSETAAEYARTNRDNHSRWVLSETFEDSLPTILAALQKKATLGSVRVLFYVPKPPEAKGQ